MQNANHIIEKLCLNGQTEQQTKHSAPAHSQEFLKAVMTSLTNMGLLVSPDRALYQTWAAGLTEFSEAQIKLGLMKARDFKGFFNLPAFRDLCRTKPEDLGLPDAKKAYVEACMAGSPKVSQRWSHPAVYHAGKMTGWYELASMPESQIFPRFERFYSEQIQRVLNGDDIAAPMVDALPEKVSVQLTPEQKENELMKLRQTTGI